ncbi:hypothetical protein C4375_05810 [Devosia sp. I507]|nr:hypothetical protein C4375_05810 [Devosia sp. I507]
MRENSTLSEILILVFFLGVAASITAIYRVARRSGVGFDNPIEVCRSSKEQRADNRAKFWRELFDPKQKLDLFLLASGFISCLSVMIILHFLV